jgi:hypothetical protein
MLAKLAQITYAQCRQNKQIGNAIKTKQGLLQWKQMRD